MLTQNMSQHKTLLASKMTQIDRLNAQIRELSATQKQETDQFLNLQRRAKLRDERLKRIENLRRVLGASSTTSPQPRTHHIGDADEIKIPAAIVADDDASANAHAIHDFLRARAPSTAVLRVQTAAYESVNAALADRSAQLRSRSLELERLYRRAVSLCTGVREESVEVHLQALVAAVESERGSLGRDEVGRVREFLMKVDSVGGAAVGVEAM